MRKNFTFYSKNLTKKSTNEISDREESVKTSVIQSLLNYSKSLEFKKSNYVNQVELVLN